MSLDDLATRAPRRRAKECGVAFALRVLPPDRAVVLQRALDNRENVGHDEILDALRSELDPAYIGDVGYDSIRRHRQPTPRCSCAGVSLVMVDTA